MPRQLLRKGMCLAAAVLTGTGSPAMSETQTTLTLDAQTMASSNPFLLPGSNRGAILTQFSASPEFKLTGDTGSSLDLSGTVSDKWFSQHYGNYVVGKADLLGRYRHNEYLTLEADGSFSHDLAVDVLTDSVDAVIDPQAIRTDYDGTLRLHWTPDAHTEIVPEIGYEATDYQNSTLLRDTRALKTSLAVSHRISPYTQLGLRVEGMFNKAAGQLAQNSQALYATLKQDLSEHWQLTAELGAQRTEQRSGPLQGQAIDGSSSSPTQLSGRAELCRKAEHGMACLSGLIDSEISGLGGLQRTMTGTATVTQDLSARTSLNGTLEYRHSQAQQQANLPTLDALRASLRLDRKLGRDLTLSATAQYLRRQLGNGGGWIGAAYGGLQLRFQPRHP